jgi:TM2 domain-containing membrane protein YozV
MTDNDPHQPPPYTSGPNPDRPDQPPQYGQPQQQFQQQHFHQQPFQQQAFQQQPFQQQAFQQQPLQPQGQLQPWQPGPSQQPMPYPPMQPAPMIKPKNPGVAAVLSFLVPGVGQLMNGDIGLGILMMILTVLAWFSLFVVIGFILLPAVYIWSIVQAYSKAKSWNVAHGIIS